VTSIKRAVFRKYLTPGHFARKVAAEEKGRAVKKKGEEDGGHPCCAPGGCFYFPEAGRRKPSSAPFSSLKSPTASHARRPIVPNPSLHRRDPAAVFAPPEVHFFRHPSRPLPLPLIVFYLSSYCGGMLTGQAISPHWSTARRASREAPNQAATRLPSI
jgi:hypothetical protein